MTHFVYCPHSKQAMSRHFVSEILTELCIFTCNVRDYDQPCWKYLVPVFLPRSASHWTVKLLDTLSLLTCPHLPPFRSSSLSCYCPPPRNFRLRYKSVISFWGYKYSQCVRMGSCVLIHPQSDSGCWKAVPGRTVERMSEMIRFVLDCRWNPGRSG